MRLTVRSPFFIRVAVAVSCGLATAACSTANSTPGAGTAEVRSSAPCAGQGGLRLPPGFCATIFPDSIGAARHLVVAPNGDVFVNLRSSRRGPLASVAAGQVGLRDSNGDGRYGTSGAQKTSAAHPTFAGGRHGTLMGAARRGGDATVASNVSRLFTENM